MAVKIIKSILKFTFHKLSGCTLFKKMETKFNPPAIARIVLWSHKVFIQEEKH